jgi:broad specificity phosphatase PhoE
MSEARTGLVLVVRHPETEANAARRYVGASESPYTPLGASQAAELAALIAAWCPDRIYTSPRERACAVARAAAGGVIPLTVLDAIGEIDFGCAEQMTADEMQAAGFSLDYPGLPGLEGTTLCGESWTSFEQRVSEAGERLAADAGRTAVVTHGGVVRVLMMSWLGLDAHAAFRLAVTNGVGALIGFEDGYARLLAFGPAELLCTV